MYTMKALNIKNFITRVWRKLQSIFLAKFTYLGMHSFKIPIWKKAPFASLLVPVITGILLQWYLQPPVKLIGQSAACFSIAFIAFQLLPLAARFKFQVLQALIINLMMVTIGLFITW